MNETPATPQPVHRLARGLAGLFVEGGVAAVAGGVCLSSRATAGASARRPERRMSGSVRTG